MLSAQETMHLLAARGQNRKHTRGETQTPTKLNGKKIGYFKIARQKNEPLFAAISPIEIRSTFNF